MGTSHFKAVNHKNANSKTQKSEIARFAGMPVGIQLAADYYIKNFKFDDLEDVPDASSSYGAGDSWTLTVTGTTPAASLSDDLVPPRLILTNSAADNDSWEGQYTDAAGAGECFAIRANKKLYFKTTFSLTDANNDIDTVTECDLFVGLAITDTTVIDGATDFIGFSKVDGSTTVNFVAGKNASASGALVDQLVQSTGVVLTAADAGTAEADLHTFEFLVDSTDTVYVWADGECVYIGRNTTQLPTDENLCPTIAFQNGEAVAKIMHISQFFFAMER